MINTTSQELILVPDGLEPRKPRFVPKISQREENVVDFELFKDIKDVLGEQLSENDEDFTDQEDAYKIALDP